MPREVLLFAALRQRYGQPTLLIEVPAGARASDLKAAIKAQFPALAPLVDTCRVAQDHSFLADSDELSASGELALIPPVSGGIDLAPSDIRGKWSRLTTAVLDLHDVLQQVARPEAGGINLFVGNVREQSRGQTVTHLDYEAYEPMAIKAMDAIAEHIMQSRAGVTVAIAHRLGRLLVGDSAVMIAASAPHRAEAFDACRQVIEDLKRDVPIWKKEHASDGSVWISQGP